MTPAWPSGPRWRSSAGRRVSRSGSGWVRWCRSVRMESSSGRCRREAGLPSTGGAAEPMVVTDSGQHCWHVRPPASYGMLCSKSQVAAGRRQTGPVQVACRAWARCRSLRPGSWPLAWNRWSQFSVVSGWSSMIRSGPAPGVRSRQVPYPPGGPFPLSAVKLNPAGPSLTPPGAPGFFRFSRPLGAGRASRALPRAPVRRSPRRTRSSWGSWPPRRRGPGPARDRSDRSRPALQAGPPTGQASPAGPSGCLAPRIRPGPRQHQDRRTRTIAAQQGRCHLGGRHPGQLSRRNRRPRCGRPRPVPPGESPYLATGPGTPAPAAHPCSPRALRRVAHAPGR